VFTTSTNYLQVAGSTLVNGSLSATGGAILNIQGGALGGSGTVNGNVLMGGTMTPGPGSSPGTLTINGNYAQTSTGTLDELISPTSRSLLQVNGSVTLGSGSTLELTLWNGYDPLGDAFVIMDYNSLCGEFSNGSSFWDDGYLWDITYGQNQIEVSAVKTPEPGTFPLLGIGMLGLVFYSWRNWARSLGQRQS
jgi:hypothetical protein